jgi:hypothetical protein
VVNFVGGGRKGRDFREILGGRVGGGYPFFGQGERRNSVKLFKIVSFDPFFILVGPKNTQKSLKLPSWAYFGLFFYLLLAFFAIFSFFRAFFFLLFKASDERGRWDPSFLEEIGVAPPPSILTHFELCSSSSISATHPMKKLNTFWECIVDKQEDGKPFGDGCFDASKSTWERMQGRDDYFDVQNL